MKRVRAPRCKCWALDRFNRLSCSPRANWIPRSFVPRICHFIHTWISHDVLDTTRVTSQRSRNKQSSLYTVQERNCPWPLDAIDCFNRTIAVVSRTKRDNTVPLPPSHTTWTVNRCSRVAAENGAESTVQGGRGPWLYTPDKEITVTSSSFRNSLICQVVNLPTTISNVIWISLRKGLV